MSVYCACLSLLLAQLCVLGAARSAVVPETSGRSEFRSDYTFSQEAAGWFKLHRVPLDWHTARVQCYHEGAVLASPLDADLWSALTTVLIKANLDSTLVYSGVSATFNDGVYSSVEGVSLEQLYIQWGKGEPNNLDGHEQCLAYYKEGDKLTVHDTNCTRLLPYICYRPAWRSDKMTECGTVDKEYKLQARTEHCYKFHAHALPWTLAARVCQAEGGYLVDINSQREADLLVDMFANKTSLHSTWSALVSVGVRMWGDNSWWTIHGKRLDESEYSLWHEGEPNNWQELPEQCGSIYIASGTLNDIPCDHPYAFICEKQPESLLYLNGDVLDPVTASATEAEHAKAPTVTSEITTPYF